MSLFLHELRVNDWKLNGHILGTNSSTTTIALSCGDGPLEHPSTSAPTPTTSARPTPKPRQECLLPEELYYYMIGSDSMSWVGLGARTTYADGTTVRGTEVMNCTWSAATRTADGTGAGGAGAGGMGAGGMPTSVADARCSMLSEGLAHEPDAPGEDWRGPAYFVPVTITANDALGPAATATAAAMTMTTTSVGAAASVGGVDVMVGVAGLLVSMAVAVGLL